MKRPEKPPHLPTPPSDRDAYEHLYRFCFGTDWEGRLENAKVRRIPAGLSAPAVYRRLPCDPDFEYGGYLTKTRIRFIRGDATTAYTDKDKPCIFHSHPTTHPYADVPSSNDIYSFLKWRQLRAITIGANSIWIWDKNNDVLSTVRRLLKWEEEHMLGELRRLCEERTEGIFEQYFILALEGIGIDCFTKAEMQSEGWCETLLNCTGIETTLIPREGDGDC